MKVLQLNLPNVFMSALEVLEKYGLRQLWFLDVLQEDTTFVRRGYTRKLDKAFRYLAFILLPSSFVEIVHKIIFFSTVKISLPYILRFEGLHKMFEGCGSDGGEIFHEHVRIRKQLSVTSHRYRFFFIASLVVITANHFATFFMVLASKSDKNFFNSGDLLDDDFPPKSNCNENDSTTRRICSSAFPNNILPTFKPGKL
ncbi:leucine-rich repeat transmembrane protein kinase [Hibiscus syriacus]|uniref:Leucine-rich repeat transmembrane protein kinase n=1 Tax=Hibiscus syriacus TaxID=106335 RepID=A0A6A3ART4_HIBSY|nr:leucine-rich repeat transmembrane protein kinase [Hibiscus syriacus]